MSLAFRLYSAFLPASLRKHTDPLQHRFHEWKVKKQKKKKNTPKVLQTRRAKLRELLQERPVRVAFQVAQLAKWKSESVLSLMQQDPHFMPFVWCVPYGNHHLTRPEAYEQEKNRIVSYFAERGIPLRSYITIDDFPAEERPDLIFIYEPYDTLFKTETFRGLEQELLCYVPYSFRNTNKVVSYDAVGKNCAVFDFIENESCWAHQKKNSANRGINAIVTGTPIADLFMGKMARATTTWKDCGKPMKKVIWAPHWTVVPDYGWFHSATFLKTVDAMMNIVERHREDIQFAFKPHPNLYRTLCELPGWGREKTDNFYRKWVEMPNTQLEEGPYSALIMQSDAMIHDSASFILEYLYADKPCMFLRENEGYEEYNQQTLDCLMAYLYGISEDEIEDFLQRCVLNTEDPLRDVRATMRERYLLPPHGKTAAQNIVDAILQV